MRSNEEASARVWELAIKNLISPHINDLEGYSIREANIKRSLIRLLKLNMSVPLSADQFIALQKLGNGRLGWRYFKKLLDNQGDL